MAIEVMTVFYVLDDISFEVVCDMVSDGGDGDKAIDAGAGGDDD